MSDDHSLHQLQSSKDTRPGPFKLSAAQKCNFDVLDIIFNGADMKSTDLSSASLTCRRWYMAASPHLYCTIRFDTSAPWASALHGLLSSRRDLLGHIRHVTLCHKSTAEPESYQLLDWISLIPAHGLLSVAFERMDDLDEPAIDVLDYPAIRTAASVAIYCPEFFRYFPERFQTVVLRPDLQELKVSSWSVPQMFRGRYSPSITKLVIELVRFTTICDYATISDILSSPDIQHLASLDITFLHITPGAHQLTNDIQRHAQTLRHFGIGVMDYGYRYSPYPDSDLNTLAHSAATMPALESAVFGVTYAPSALTQLPASLHTLTLLAARRTRPPGPLQGSHFPADIFATALYLAHEQGAHLPARLVVIDRADDYDDNDKEENDVAAAVPDTFEALENACNALGIAFTLERGGVWEPMPVRALCKLSCTIIPPCLPRFPGVAAMREVAERRCCRHVSIVPVSMADRKYRSDHGMPPPPQCIFLNDPEEPVHIIKLRRRKARRE